MANFPSLSRNPSAREFEETVAYDPTVRARSEGGYVKTRPRYTRFPKKWTVVYDLLSNTDKGTLQTFEEARSVGSENFTWTNPQDSTQYDVRFAGPVTYRYTDVFIGSARAWKVEFELEEV